LALYTECEPGFLIIDYLQKFKPRERDTRQGVTEVAEMLRRFATKGWGVLALSATARQPGKNGSSHDSLNLNLASFKESGEIEFNLDAAYVIRDIGQADESNHHVHSVKLDCVKNRFGEMKSMELVFNKPRLQFELPAENEPQNHPEFPIYEGDPFADSPNAFPGVE
jgi:replicative DNA helicase